MTTVLERANEEDEASLLDRLTRLEAQIEGRSAATDYRFAAAAAYYELVQRRIAELREHRIRGLQTFGEFTERRLAPAMHTCRMARPARSPCPSASRAPISCSRRASTSPANGRTRRCSSR